MQLFLHGVHFLNRRKFNYWYYGHLGISVYSDAKFCKRIDRTTFEKEA